MKRRIQIFIVDALEKTCAVKDKTWLKRVPLMWVGGCNLASLSAELDEKWGTDRWCGPDDPRYVPFVDEDDDDE